MQGLESTLHVPRKTTHERKGDLQGKKRSANVYMYSIVTHNNTIQTSIALSGNHRETASTTQPNPTVTTKYDI